MGGLVGGLVGRLVGRLVGWVAVDVDACFFNGWLGVCICG